MKPGLEQTCVVMRKHSPRFKFLFLVHLFFLIPIINNKYHAHSFQLHIETVPTVYHGDVYVVTRKLPIGVVHLYNIMYNIKYIKDCLETVAIATFSAWLFVLLLISGDVHSNPGPASTSSISSSSSSSRDSSSFFNSMNFCKRLSFIHYNVQSIANRIDILSAELTDFDILAFSETWLHPDIHTNDFIIPEYLNGKTDSETAIVTLWYMSKTPCFIKEDMTLNHTIQNAFGSRFTWTIHVSCLVYSTAPLTQIWHTFLGSRTPFHWL